MMWFIAGDSLIHGGLRLSSASHAPGADMKVSEDMDLAIIVLVSKHVSQPENHSVSGVKPISIPTGGDDDSHLHAVSPENFQLIWRAKKSRPPAMRTRTGSIAPFIVELRR
jgi:hypothetical protein